jgi:hypothetical protein
VLNHVPRLPGISDNPDGVDPGVLHFYLHPRHPLRNCQKNNHPHTDAIHIGCVLSLFTLHAMWPILFLWAKISPRALKVDVTGSAEVLELRKRIESLEQQLNKVTTSGTGESHHA